MIVNDQKSYLNLNDKTRGNSLTQYHFDDHLRYFSQTLKSSLPSDLEMGEGIDLTLDETQVSLNPSSSGLTFSVSLGLLLFPVPEQKLLELLTHQYLDVGTAGFKFCLDSEGVVLSLKTTFSFSTPPQESFDWLHRLMFAAKEWTKRLESWEEFVPFHSIKNEAMP